MNTDQLNSFVRSVLKIAGAILVAHGAGKAAAIVNTEDVAGIVVTLVGLFMSHQQHAGLSEAARASADPQEIIRPFAFDAAPPGEQATGKSPEPADKNVVATAASVPASAAAPRASNEVNTIAGVSDTRHS